MAIYGRCFGIRIWVAPVIGLAVLAQGAAAAAATASAAEPSRVSRDLPRNYTEYPAIVVPMDQSKPLEFHSMTFVDNPGRDLQKKVFKRVEVAKGDVLEINSFVIANNLLAAMSGLTRKTDALQVGDVEFAIDTRDGKELLKLLVAVGEERKHAESNGEWDTIVEKFGGREHPQRMDRARFNPYLFGTSYLEVSGKKLKGADPDLRYFVSVDEVLDGAGEIDVDSSKLKVVTGLSLHIFDTLAGSDIPKSKARLAKEVKKVSTSIQEVCIEGNCNLTGESPVGLLLVDLHRIYRAGDDLKLKDSDLAILRLRKQICLLKRLQEFCPRAKGLSSIEAIVRSEKISCQDDESMLKGFAEESGR